MNTIGTVSRWLWRAELNTVAVDRCRDSQITTGTAQRDRALACRQGGRPPSRAVDHRLLHPFAGPEDVLGHTCPLSARGPPHAKRVAGGSSRVFPVQPRLPSHREETACPAPGLSTAGDFATTPGARPPEWTPVRSAITAC